MGNKRRSANLKERGLGLAGHMCRNQENTIFRTTCTSKHRELQKAPVRKAPAQKAPAVIYRKEI